MGLIFWDELEGFLFRSSFMVEFGLEMVLIGDEVEDILGDGWFG